MQRTCEISSDIFGGYRYQVDLTNIDSIEEIIALVITDLRSVLHINNLLSLIHHLNNTKWHIHSASLDEIIANPDIIIWICDHC
jgi:hypothetical protein